MKPDRAAVMALVWDLKKLTRDMTEGVENSQMSRVRAMRVAQCERWHGYLLGMLHAGEPVNSGTMHNAWRDAARFYVRVKQAELDRLS